MVFRLAGHTRIYNELRTFPPARSLPKISDIPSIGRDGRTPIFTNPDKMSDCNSTSCIGTMIGSSPTPQTKTSTPISDRGRDPPTTVTDLLLYLSILGWESLY